MILMVVVGLIGAFLFPGGAPSKRRTIRTFDAGLRRRYLAIIPRFISRRLRAVCENCAPAPSHPSKIDPPRATPLSLRP
jgi:hypothetical protein